jgi:hypothetical protein
VTLFDKNLPLFYDYDVFLVESNAAFNEANCERVEIQKNMEFTSRINLCYKILVNNT